MKNKNLKSLEELKEVDVLLKVANDKLAGLEPIPYENSGGQYESKTNLAMDYNLEDRKNIDEMMGLL